MMQDGKSPFVATVLGVICIANLLYVGWRLTLALARMAQLGLRSYDRVPCGSFCLPSTATGETHFRHERC
ncbi:hypothetical protein LF1_58540 [Rubripirellula obstinata]|uniref:Uncharacterized protein n=1 Tax=Rubripirellula obstinata TaxID=406547 RepID=A0A5B1C8L9_9BACT|nr:hypothetical protein LF1_58540 [Rubripirellula obstinata]